ncbi:MAG: triphosphoribosyl-dephospho-CoA synthase [Thermoplasmata archaeon]
MRQGILKKLEVATTKALVLECTVPKPGNVSRYHDFPEQKFEHFLVSSIELGAKLPGLAAKFSLGSAVLEGTRLMLEAQGGGNTHLGSILLLTPLLASAFRRNGKLDFEDVERRIREATWKETLKYVQAIRMTDFEKLPDIDGSLNVKSAGIESYVRKNRIGLYDWMLAGVPVNGICHEYTHCYALTRKTAEEITGNWEHGIEKAVQHGFLYALGNYVDNLVIGKKGLDYALELQNEARKLHAERAVFAKPGSRSNDEFRQLFEKLERDNVNPGTTADIIVAALFLVFLDGRKI